MEANGRGALVEEGRVRTKLEERSRWLRAVLEEGS